MAKNGGTNGASKAGSKAVVDGVFRLDRVETSEDLPKAVWEEIHKEFPLTRFIGEVPTTGGSVVVGRPLPKNQWHIIALMIAKRFDGKPLTPFAPAVV